MEDGACQHFPNDEAPLRWLRLGWRDFQRAPRLSFMFGIAIMLASVAVSALAWLLGRFALQAALPSGFLFVAPLMTPRPDDWPVLE
ncbi:MAG: hypothetical protein ACKVQA_25430 [Burkholderiales bacterium]